MIYDFLERIYEKLETFFNKLLDHLSKLDRSFLSLFPNDLYNLIAQQIVMAIFFLVYLLFILSSNTSPKFIYGWVFANYYLIFLPINLFLILKKPKE